LPLLLSLLCAGETKNTQAATTHFLFGPATPVAELNAKDFGDVHLSLTPDGLEAFFARTTWDSKKELRKSAEIYTTRRKSTDEPFETPKSVAELAPPKTWGDTAPSISADGLTLYFGRAPNGASMPSEEERLKIQGVFAATRPSRSAPFGPAVEITGLKAPADTGGIGRPEISADGLSLYMQHVYPEPRRDSDVFVSQRASVNDPWGVAKPIPEFATSNPVNYLWESAPGVTADGQGLFLELGWYGGGPADLPDSRGASADLYFSQRDGQGGWSKPVNLGDTINLAGRYETDPFLSADGSTLYFNRAIAPDGGPQNATWDLYQAPVLPFAAVPLAGHGGAYQQNFDSLGDTSRSGQAFPDGWTFSANNVVFNNATTRGFPSGRFQYASVYNGGAAGQSDRALVTEAGRLEDGELNLRVLVKDNPVKALELAFDLEVWDVSANNAFVNNAEAAFEILLEADTGSGFVEVADLGTVTTGPTLARPTTGSLVNGNDPAYRLPWKSGLVNVDVPENATLRVRWLATDATPFGVRFGLDNVLLQFIVPEPSALGLLAVGCALACCAIRSRRRAGISGIAP
jgi:hypothetical protein